MFIKSNAIKVPSAVYGVTFSHSNWDCCLPHKYFTVCVSLPVVNLCTSTGLVANLDESLSNCRVITVGDKI